MPRVQIDQPEHYPFATPIAVRISDTNYGGHLGNDALLSLLHEARLRFFQALGYRSELDLDGDAIIMADSAIQYRSEAFQGQTLCFEVAACDLGKYGCDIVYRVSDRDDGREVALAKTGVLFFDYDQRRVQPLPGHFAAALQRMARKAA